MHKGCPHLGPPGKPKADSSRQGGWGHSNMDVRIEKKRFSFFYYYLEIRSVQYIYILPDLNIAC